MFANTNFYSKSMFGNTISNIFFTYAKVNFVLFFTYPKVGLTALIRKVAE